MDTKIWSYQSPWDEGRHNPPLNDGEGKNRPDICTKDAENEQAQDDAKDDTDIFEKIADLLVPNPDERQKMRDNKDRMFHPKKSGYQFFANSWMDKIKANRKEEEPPQDPPEDPKPTKAMAFL